MNILGVSALYHDSAAALIVDGEIIAAAQEERFSRKKHDPSMPYRAIDYCLTAGNISPDSLDYVVYYDNPLLTLDRYIKNVLALGTEAEDLIKFNHQKMFSAKLWVHELLKRKIPSLGQTTKFMVTKHHISHAASAFYPSPFRKSVIMTLDGVGEWTTLAIGLGEDNKIFLKEELRYPHSLGLLYSAFTYFCGFKVNSGDYKFMGLAPYGKPVYYDLICNEIIDIKEDGSFCLNLKYFDYQNGRTMINEKELSKLFDGGRRLPETQITKREMDIAASVQAVTEEVILKISAHAKNTYGRDCDNIVMAGGVALNCVANGKLKRSKIFENIWIQPAAGDAGGALGAALYVHYHFLGNPRSVSANGDNQKGSYLGPEYSSVEIKKFLDEHDYPYDCLGDECSKIIAQLLDKQKIIGVFQGRMEFGPRALGNRSIIADPRSPEMQARLNLKIKFRESFRPFAPSVLLDRVADYFELSEPSPYMLLCADVRSERRLPFTLDEHLTESGMDMLPVVSIKRSDIPAVTHVDYSARIQTVDKAVNPKYYAIIKAFEELTGCGVIVNTSFNLRGEPIVCTLEDAYKCFMRSEMDVLLLGNYLLYKDKQPVWKDIGDWRSEYGFD